MPADGFVSLSGRPGLHAKTAEGVGCSPQIVHGLTQSQAGQEWVQFAGYNRQCPQIIGLKPVEGSCRHLERKGTRAPDIRSALGRLIQQSRDLRQHFFGQVDLPVSRRKRNPPGQQAGPGLLHQCRLGTIPFRQRIGRGLHRHLAGLAGRSPGVVEAKAFHAFGQLLGRPAPHGPRPGRLHVGELGVHLDQRVRLPRPLSAAAQRASALM